MIERLAQKRIHDRRLNLKVQGTISKIIEELPSHGIVKLLRYVS